MNCPRATSAEGLGSRSPDVGERLGEPVLGGEVTVGAVGVGGADWDSVFVEQS